MMIEWHPGGVRGVGGGDDGGGGGDGSHRQQSSVVSKWQYGW